MKYLLSLLAATAVLLGAPVHAQTAKDDPRAPVEQYFRGHATGDGAVMRQAFLPTAHIEGNRNGAFSSWTVDEYVALFKGPAPDESSRQRTIDSLDVSGDAAIAKATLVHGPVTFTDYLLLLKVNGEWKIANKIFYANRGAGK